MSAALQRSSRWQGSISQLQRQTVGLRQIPRSGVSHVTAEHRIYTVKPTTGVSDNMPLAKVQDLLQRKLGPLINGACRQSFPQGHRRILPDPCAPGFAALLAVLNTSHIHLVCPDTQASALVAVDNTLSLGAVHPLKLLFRQIPLELSGIGFPEAILQLAGYEVLTEGPLLSPASGSVRLVQYGPGTDKASQQPDDSIVCVQVIPPADDPYLQHLPPRIIIGGGQLDIFTSVERDPFPRIPRTSIYRDPPVAENLPDHLDFGDFRPEAEEMEVERLATIQEGDERGHTGASGGGAFAAGPPPAADDMVIEAPATAEAAMQPPAAVDTAAVGFQPTSAMEGPSTTATKTGFLVGRQTGDDICLPMPPLLSLSRISKLDCLFHSDVATGTNPPPPSAAVAAAVAVPQVSSLPSSRMTTRSKAVTAVSDVSTSGQPPPPPPLRPPPSPLRPPPPPPPPPPSPPSDGKSLVDRAETFWRRRHAKNSPPPPSSFTEDGDQAAASSRPASWRAHKDPLLRECRALRREFLADRQADGRRWVGQYTPPLSRRGRAETSLAGSEDLPPRTRAPPLEWWITSAMQSRNNNVDLPPTGQRAPRRGTKTVASVRSPRPAGSGQ